MSVLNKTEFFNAITDFIGDNSDDKTIKFLDDMQDTYNALEKKVEDANGTDWQKKYEENDKAWRLRYKARWENHFDGNPTEPEVDPELKELERAKNMTIENLFSNGEGGKK